MASIKKIDNRGISSWKVSWKQDYHAAAGGVSRSKLLRTHEEALKFKELVEAGEDRYPGVAPLVKHGLVDYVEQVNPMILLAVRQALDLSPDDPAQAVKAVRFALQVFGDPTNLLAPEEWPTMEDTGLFA